MFEGQRIFSINLDRYVNYEKFIITKFIPCVPILIQDNYGEIGDCALVTITAAVKNLAPILDIQTIYNYTEFVARQYGYNGNTHGTFYLTIKNITNKVLSFFQLSQRAKSHYLKNICFDYEDIKYEIDHNRPVILNIKKDGRNFYTNHTVLITGYCYTQHYKMLVIHDNWNNTVSYVDYDKLNLLCSIQTIQ